MQGSPCALSAPPLFPSLPLPLRPLSRRTPSQGQPPTQAARFSCNDLPRTCPAGHHRGGSGRRVAPAERWAHLVPSLPVPERDSSETIHLPHLSPAHPPPHPANPHKRHLTSVWMIITPTNMLRKTKEASKTKMMVNERLRIKFRASSCSCRSVQPSTCSGRASAKAQGGRPPAHLP